MQHVHWWLFALSFFLGLGLTFMLLKKGKRTAESEPPTTKIVVAEDPPTTKIHVAEDPPTTRFTFRKRTTRRSASCRNAPTTKIPVDRNRRRRKSPSRKSRRHRRSRRSPFAPYGPGSARAPPKAPDRRVAGQGPLRHRLYYTPDDATYERTVAQVWFKDEESAKRAYFTPWRQELKK